MRTRRMPDKRRYRNAVNRIEQADVPFVETRLDFTVKETVQGCFVVPVEPPLFCDEWSVAEHQRWLIR